MLIDKMTNGNTCPARHHRKAPLYSHIPQAACIYTSRKPHLELRIIGIVTWALRLCMCGIYYPSNSCLLEVPKFMWEIQIRFLLAVARGDRKPYSVPQLHGRLAGWRSEEGGL